MAHPALAKILSKIAIDALVDEKKRKTTLMIILAPTIFLLTLIAFILYILTSPLSMIADFFMPEEIAEIEKMQSEFNQGVSESKTALDTPITIDERNMKDDTILNNKPKDELA